MEWLWTAALVPFLFCGLMCLGSIALAAVGWRRTRSRRDCCGGAHEQDDAGDTALVP
jgi:hypothetical protein